MYTTLGDVHHHLYLEQFLLIESSCLDLQDQQQGMHSCCSAICYQDIDHDMMPLEDQCVQHAVSEALLFGKKHVVMFALFSWHCCCRNLFRRVRNSWPSKDFKSNSFDIREKSALLKSLQAAKPIHERWICDNICEHGQSGNTELLPGEVLLIHYFSCVGRRKGYHIQQITCLPLFRVFRGGIKLRNMN